MSSLDSVMKESGTDGDNNNNNDDSVGDIMEQAMEIFKKSGVPDASLADLIDIDFKPVKSKRRSCKAKLNKRR